MSQGFTKGTPIDTDPTLSLNSDIVVPSQKAVKSYLAANYQPTLVSGTNIKTVNGNSLLGSGDLIVGGGGLTVGTTPIASGTIGRILFENGGNVLGQDSALFWDNTNKRLGIGATPSTSVRLDVRAQGALSTDIAFRVRNSADTRSNLTVNGLGQTRLLSNSFSGNFFTISYVADNLVERDAFIFTQNVQNAMGQAWTFDAGYNGVQERLTISNNLTGNNQGIFSIHASNFCFGTTILNSDNTADRRVLRIATGVAPTTSFTDGFKFYSADRGGTAGRASAHFRSEDGTINVLGDLSGIGTSSPAARLDVRAQGALSTDIAFRVRNSADTFNFLSIDGVGLVSGRTDGAGGFNMNYQGTTNTTVQLTFNNGNPTLRVANSNAGGNAFNVYTSSDNREYLAGLIGKATFAVGANPLGGTIKPNEANTNTIYVFNGTAPTLSATDSFNLYSADITAGNAAPHFRTENGSIIKLFQGAALTASDGTLANAVTRIAEIQARLQAHGLIA
jgi:hypothetical protein